MTITARDAIVIISIITLKNNVIFIIDIEITNAMQLIVIVLI